MPLAAESKGIPQHEETKDDDLTSFLLGINGFLVLCLLLMLAWAVKRSPVLNKRARKGYAASKMLPMEDSDLEHTDVF